MEHVRIWREFKRRPLCPLGAKGSTLPPVPWIVGIRHDTTAEEIRSFHHQERRDERVHFIASRWSPVVEYVDRRRNAHVHLKKYDDLLRCDYSVCDDIRRCQLRNTSWIPKLMTVHHDILKDSLLQSCAALSSFLARERALRVLTTWTSSWE